MNILLLNDNPVVTKLVTLSAQKTGDRITAVGNVNEIEVGSYDLIVVDDGVYSEGNMEELEGKVSYKSSMIIVSRGTQKIESFDYELKKPFLPTDLVEQFSSISKKVSQLGEHVSMHNEVNLQDDLTDNTFSHDDGLGDLDLNKELDFSDDLNDFHLDLGDMNIDSEIKNHDFDMHENEEHQIGSILDEEDVQEVKNLLNETDSTEDEDHEFKIDDLDELKWNLDDEEEVSSEVSSHDEVLKDEEPMLIEEENITLSSSDTSLEDDFDWNFEEDGNEEVPQEGLAQEDFDMDEKLLEPLENNDFYDNFNQFDVAQNEEELPLQSVQTQNYMDNEILDEDLFAEEESKHIVLDEPIDDARHFDAINEPAILNEAEYDFTDDAFGELSMLDEHALKVALGEEEEFAEFPEIDEPAEELSEQEETAQVPQEANVVVDGNNEQTPEGVEALKSILKALSNEDVVASLKGMNISINISFGGKSE